MINVFHIQVEELFRLKSEVGKLMYIVKTISQTRKGLTNIGKRQQFKIVFSSKVEFVVFLNGQRCIDIGSVLIKRKHLVIGVLCFTTQLDLYISSIIVIEKTIVVELSLSFRSKLLWS